MAALFRMPSTTEPTTSTLAKDNLPLIQSPRSYHLPAYPETDEWNERRAGVSSAQRIAHWDKKREKCANCKHIYLKTLSLHAGYCSVDCKSNAAYMDKVQRTIKAVRSAVHQRQQQDDAKEDHQETVEQSADNDNCSDAVTTAHTFAAFGAEARAPTEQNVEWAFSAIY